MSRILIVCYSRTGTCETIARALARELGADLDIVQPTQSYKGAIGFARGLVQSLLALDADLTSSRNPREFDLVVVGSPVWAGRMAAPMRSYLRLHGRNIRRIGAFCVSGRGGEWPKVSSEIEMLSGMRPAFTISLSQKEVRGSDPKLLIAPLLVRIQALARLSARQPGHGQAAY